MELLGIVLDREGSKILVLDPIKIIEYTDFDDTGNVETQCSFVQYNRFTEDPIFEFDSKDILNISLASTNICELYIAVVDSIEDDKVRELEYKQKAKKKPKKSKAKNLVNVIDFNEARNKLLNKT